MITSGLVLAALWAGAWGLHWQPCTTDHFHWHDDESKLECATVTVPLDYEDSPLSPQNRLPIQVVRLPALHQPALESIIWNPGGPGVEGARYLRYRGAELQRQVRLLRVWLATRNRKLRLTLFAGRVVAAMTLYLSIRGESKSRCRGSWAGHLSTERTHTEADRAWLFSRGTGNTLPIACWDDPSERPSEMVATDTSALRNAFQESAQLASACYDRSKKIGNLVGTSYTARDVWKIVDALGGDRMLRFWGESSWQRTPDADSCRPDTANRAIIWNDLGRQSG